MREVNVGEEWHETDGNSDRAKKNTPKKHEGNETVFRPMQKKSKRNEQCRRRDQQEEETELENLQ